MTIRQFFGETVLTNLFESSSTTVQLTAGSNLRVGGIGVNFDSAANLDLSTAGLGGLDTGTVAVATLYNVFVVVSGGTAGLVASTSLIAPTGFLVSKWIGQVSTRQGSAIINHVSTDILIEDGEFTYSEARGDFVTSGTGWTLDTANITYFSSNSHRISFNITGDTSNGAQTSQDINITGLTFDNFNQGLAIDIGASGSNSGISRATAGTNQIHAAHPSYTNPTYRFSGFVGITAQPTWVL